MMQPSSDTPTIHYALGRCTLGDLLVAGVADGVCAIELADTPDEAIASVTERFAGRMLVRDDAGMGEWCNAVAAFIDGTRSFVDAPLAHAGTEFQRRVWERLCAIPVGRTETYQNLARELGDAGALRAVAGACAANPLAVVIPCHRVLRTDGELGGYRWGIERKRTLLKREGAIAELSLFD